MYLPTTLLLLPLLPLAFSAPPPCRNLAPITNPSFESGSPPPFPPPSPAPSRGWFIGSISGSSTYTYTSPGSPQIPPSPTTGGARAFTATLIPNPSSKGFSGVSLLQNLYLCAGANYSVQVDYKFQSGGDVSNDCRLLISYPDYRAVGGGGGSVEVGSAVVTGGVWSNTAGFFPAGTSEKGLLAIYTSCRYGVQNQISVDNVRVDKFNGNV